jgi:DNA-directed RNA polymerase specialized sigma24 family protein
MIEYTNSEISYLIDEYIHSERDRKILKRRYIDGQCFEPLAEEFDLSVRQVKNIVYKHETILLKELEDVSNSELSILIDEWIKSERDRAILKRRLIDGICYEPLAEEFDLSVRQVKNIIYKGENILFSKIS